MPEYTFDPSTGEGVEVGRGPQQQQTYEEVQEQHHQKAAQNYQRRHASEATPLTGDPELESRLVKLQSQLNDPNLNYAERLQLESLAYQIAGRLSGGDETDGGEAILNEAPTITDNSVEEYSRQLAEEGTHNEDLQFAAEHFDTEVSEAINTALDEATDPTQIQSAMGAISQIRKNPDWIGQGEEVTSISNTAYQEIAESFDAETADAIRIINENLVAGNISKGEAMKTAMKSPRVLNALLSAAQSGLITLAL